MERFHILDVLTALTCKPVTLRPYPETAIRDVLTWMKRPANLPADQAFKIDPQQLPAVAAEARAALLGVLPKLDWTLEELDDVSEVTESTVQHYRVIWATRHGQYIELPKLPTE